MAEQMIPNGAFLVGGDNEPLEVVDCKSLVVRLVLWVGMLQEQVESFDKQLKEIKNRRPTGLI